LEVAALISSDSRCDFFIPLAAPRRPPLIQLCPLYVKPQTVVFSAFLFVLTFVFCRKTLGQCPLGNLSLPPGGRTHHALDCFSLSSPWIKARLHPLVLRHRRGFCACLDAAANGISLRSHFRPDTAPSPRVMNSQAIWTRVTLKPPFYFKGSQSFSDPLSCSLFD